MSVIKLKKLILKNFKGIKNLTVDFESVTNIYGENKLGKTTIFDGFTWLLFDKDSKDRSKFEIQPLDEKNNVVHMIETEAIGILEVDGKLIELKKILKEKWVKKRGEIDSELKGNETLYYINEVPLKLSEYKDKISSIIDEQLFKLISNPLYFSSNMKWQDRRKVILDIIGDITADRVINYNPRLEPIIKLLNDTDIESFNKLIAARKKKLNEDKKSIPYRIDELNNSINSEVDFEAIDFRKRGILAGIASIEEKLMDSSKLSQDLLKEKDRLYEIKSKLRDIEFHLNEEAQQPLKQLKFDLRDTENQIYKVENQADRIKHIIDNNKNEVVNMEKDLQGLRDTYYSIRDEELKISENQFCCPTCKRKFEAEDIQAKKKEIAENFNGHKNKRLEDIDNKGKSKRDLLERLQAEIKRNEAELEDLNITLSKLRSSKEEKQVALDNFNPVVELAVNSEHKGLKVQEEELEDKIRDSELPSKSELINQKQIELKAKKQELELELEEVNTSLGFKEQNVKTKARIAELLAEEKGLAERIAELEGQEYLCEQYIKTKVELLEAGINSKFKFVRFKLFNTLVNGAVEECCEALVDGVPFSNTNTAAQINAGIDVINALCEHYKMEAPVFIDNRESINEILECNSQIINLIVSKDKKLVIENKESEVA